MQAKKNFSYIVVEDVDLQRLHLISMLKKRLDLRLLGAFETAKDAFEYLSKEGAELPDLLFLDIEMPEVNGLYFLGSIKNFAHQPKVIITSAHEEYAIPSYDYNVSGYVLKPLDEEKLNKAIEKVINELKQNQPEKLEVEPIAPLPIETELSEPTSFLIQVADRMVKIVFEELMYCEGANNNIRVVTINDVHETRKTLKDMLIELPDREFVRIHDSFIINLSYLKSYTKRLTVIELSHEQKSENVPVGRKYRAGLKEILQNYAAKK